MYSNEAERANKVIHDDNKSQIDVTPLAHAQQAAQLLRSSVVGWVAFSQHCGPQYQQTQSWC